MKNRIFLAFLFAIANSLCFAQDWSNEQTRIIKKFNLSENDHRGVIFINSGSECDEQAESPIDAVKIFFEQAKNVHMPKNNANKILLIKTDSINKLINASIPNDPSTYFVTTPTIQL